MTQGKSVLQVYGHPASQPSRTVFWACVISDLPFELHADPATRSAVNPRGQLPSIIDDGFNLAEMPAILCYLAEKHEWQNLYPTDSHFRARIHQYLHAHHSLTRLATLKLMAPHVMIVFDGLPNASSRASDRTVYSCG